MIEELETKAKQASLELIALSEKLSATMQTWGELLEKKPDIITAKISAGFITLPEITDVPEMVIDVQALPEDIFRLRTWAMIESTTGGNTYFNGTQITFNADREQIQSLVAKGKDISREDIRKLLVEPTSRLATITVSVNTGGDGANLTYGTRLELELDNAAYRPDQIQEVIQALDSTIKTLKLSS